MKNKRSLKKVSLLSATVIFLIISLNSYGQSYLPLTGGTLTGNLVMDGGTQLQTSYLNFSTYIAAPANSNTTAIFNNSTSSTIDFVSTRWGWRFIPQNSSSYAAPVFTIDNVGNTKINGGGEWIVGTTSPSGAAFARGLLINANNPSNLATSGISGMFVSVGTFASTTAYSTNSVSLLDLGGIFPGANHTITNAYGINMTTTTAGSGNTITNAYGINMTTVHGSGNTITNAYGINIAATTAGLTSNFDIAVGSTSGVTGNYSIYDASSNNNYFKGNVGIGTASPANKLDVQGGNASVYNTGVASAFYVGSGATGKTNLALSTSADASGYGIIQSVSAAGSTYGNTIINPNGGGVGINTTYISPGYQLAVNGSVLATAVTVQVRTSWPDYVFKPKYQLPSLTEVKTYIDKNQHLPEIPSAQQIEKDGLNLGEMNKLLLKKVEELTLYLIEKDKEIKADQAQMSEFKRQLTDIEKKLSQLSK